MSNPNDLFLKTQTGAYTWKYPLAHVLGVYGKTPSERTVPLSQGWIPDGSLCS